MKSSRFACQECGHVFRSIQAAERASFGPEGCPECGGADIDLAKEPHFQLDGVDGEMVPVTLSEFLGDNRELRGTSVERAVRALRIGETYRDGGGAQPVWALRRVS